MVRRMLYLRLDPGSSIWLGLCVDPDYSAEAGITPPPSQAPACWHLKNQIALSSETWGVKDSVLVSGVAERENMWSLKKSKNIEGNTLTPRKMREMSFKAAPSLDPFLILSCAGRSSWKCFQPGFGSNHLSGKICFQYERFLWVQETALHTKPSLWGLTELRHPCLAFCFLQYHTIPKGMSGLFARWQCQVLLKGSRFWLPSGIRTPYLYTETHLVMHRE